MLIEPFPASAWLATRTATVERKSEAPRRRLAKLLLPLVLVAVSLAFASLVRAVETTPTPAVEAPPQNGKCHDLHKAVMRGDVDRAAEAIANGCNVDEKDRNGLTPLILAVRKGFVVIVEQLAAAKADPNVRAPDGATALCLSVSTRRPGLVDLVMRMGADVTIPCPIGDTPALVAQRIFGLARRNSTYPGLLALLDDSSYEPDPGKFEACKKFGDPNEGPEFQIAKTADRVLAYALITDEEWNKCVKDGDCKRRARVVMMTLGITTAGRSVPEKLDYVSWISKKSGKDYWLMNMTEYYHHSALCMPAPAASVVSMPSGGLKVKDWLESKNWLGGELTKYGTFRLETAAFAVARWVRRGE